MLSKETLLSLFDYKEGNLFSKKTGKQAGYTAPNGYTWVAVNKERHGLHRLVYQMHYGDLTDMVDHIDGNPRNNCIENLRKATPVTNQQNRKLNTNNTSGAKGVIWNQRREKWLVQFRVNGLRKFFGYFADFELADLVATEARNKYHGAFTNHGVLN